MKAGTAQKLVLNMLSTAAMIRLGRVYNNWMVDLSMSNEKLRRRGLRILEEATGAGARRTRSARWRDPAILRVALLMLETGESAAEARHRLKQSAGNLRRALATHFAKESARSRGFKASVRRRNEYMDRFRIEGGKSPARHGTHQRREEFRASGDGRGAAHLRARAPAKYSSRARHHHHGAAVWRT